MKEDSRSASQSSKGSSVAYTALSFLSTWWQRTEFLIVMLMMLQVCLSLVVLMVILARALSS
jgi:hypothetical protein